MADRRRWSTPYLVALGAALLIAGMSAAVYQRISVDRAISIGAAERENANLALTLGELNSRALRNVQDNLTEIAAALASHGRTDNLLPALDHRVVNVVLRVDRAGAMHRLDGPMPQAVNVADRDYFEWHRTHPSHDVFVGRPVLGRLTGLWTIPVSIRVDRPDGTFDGCILASVKPDYFSALYGKPDLGAKGRIMLVGADGYVRAQSGGPRSLDIRGDLRASSVTHRAQAQPTGHFVSRGQLDGVRRFVSYYRLPEYPSLIITVGRAESEVLGAHNHRKQVILLVFAVLCAAVLMLAWLVWAAIERERRHGRALAESEARYRTIFESAVEGIFQSTPEGRLLAANPAMARIAGYASAEDMLRAARDLRLGYRDPSRRDDFRRRVEADGYVNEFEYELVRRDGSCVWVSENARAVRDEGGGIVAYEGFITDITERKRTEAALRESEGRYRKAAAELGAIVDESLDVICSLDREGRFVHVSAAAEQVWGYRPEELIGRVARDLTHSDDLERTREAMERVMQGEPTRAFENRNLRRDGSVAHMMWSARWIEQEQAMFCVGRDVTEVKLVTEANKLLAERLRETLETLTSGFVTLDASWRFTYVNREAERIFGRRRESLLGRVCWNEIPGSYDSEFGRGFREAMTRRGPVQVEAYHPPYSRWFEARAYPTGDGGIAIYFYDVSERRQALARLEESERRFESIAFATSDVIWDWDADTGYIWRSAGLKAIYGHDETTCPPTFDGWLALVHEEDRERVRRGIHEALFGEGSKWSAEYRFLKGDGRYAIVIDRGTILRDASGRPVRSVGGMTDVTEQRELERQLMRSQRLDSLGTLAGGVAHDLNNVLTPITMGLNLLADAALRSDERAILETVRLSAARGAQMVKQVLSFARGMEGQRVEVQPRLVVQELERMIRETFPRNIRIATRVPERLPVVSGDPTQLHQVLLNLCLNARDAMPEGGRLTLRVRHGRVASPMPSASGEIPPGHYLRLEVEDEGCGIDESLLERIFDPFFTTKPRGEGTGLGLSTTLAIVRRHQGHIMVRSKPGAGSCFTVLLPVSEETAASEAVVAPVRRRRGSGETILLVDDERDIRELACAALHAAGYAVVTASDGREALAMLHDGASARVVVTDMMMPGMDGRELVRALRHDHPALPVICTSGIVRADWGDALDMVGCPFLPKPYTAEALVAAVHDALERAARASTVANA